MYYTRPWPLRKLLFSEQMYCVLSHCLLFAGICILDICMGREFLSKISLALSFLSRVLGKQLLLPKDEGFQHFQSRSYTCVDTKCLPGLHESSTNIKEYVHYFKFSFWSSFFRNMYKYYFCITETLQSNMHFLLSLNI